MAYSDGFRSRVVERALAPHAPRMKDLAREVGISSDTLFRWKREALSLSGMGKTRRSYGGRGGGPRAWSWEQKFQVVSEASRLGEDELGTFLREKGVHEAQLQQWRDRIATALGPNALPPRREDAKRIRKLEKRLREAEALLDLAKKVHELWGDEGGDTFEKNER